MVGVWSRAEWSRWSASWARLKLAPGTLLTPQLRLVRPVMDPGTDNVWVADHLALRLVVAVRFGRPAAGSENAGPEGAAARTVSDAEAFSRQAQSSAHIADPHLVQVFEHGMAKGGVPFIVTELLEGKSLRQRISYGAALSLAEVQAVVLQTASALAKAHALLLAHGSICPDNLCLTEVAGQPFVKLLNFGGTVGESSSDARVSANHAYLSPEQLLLAAGPDAQSDLWALAVTLYELLTTTLPFEAPTAAGVSVAICNAQFSAPSHYRADLTLPIDHWFARALARDPMHRFADAYELARGFNHALASSNAEALDQEEDEDEQEERTVKWDLPQDWELPGTKSQPAASPPWRSPAAGQHGMPAYPPLPGAAEAAPSRALPMRALPTQALSTQALSTQALSTQALSTQALSTQPVGVLPRAYPASVSAAFSPGVARAAPSRPQQLRPSQPVARPSPRWWAAVMLSAALVLLFWVYKSVGGNPQAQLLEATESGTASGTQSRTSALSGGAQARASAAERTMVTSSPIGQAGQLDPGDLPQIIASDELPTAPEETDEDATPANADTRKALAPSPLRAPAPRTLPTHPIPPPRDLSGAALPHPSTSGNATSGNAVPPVQKLPAHPAAGSVPSAAPRNVSAPPVPKRAKPSVDCNPPFYIDHSNIKRLKLECL